MSQLLGEATQTGQVFLSKMEGRALPKTEATLRKRTAMEDFIVKVRMFGLIWCLKLVFV
jgi:hypothetical protein